MGIRIRQSIFVTLFVASVLISSLPVRAQIKGEISIIENGTAGITIIYTPVIVQKTQTMQNVIYTEFATENTIYEAGPGEPLIPQRQVLIAIPENADPVIDMVENNYQTYTDITAVNTPGTAVPGTQAFGNRLYPGEEFTGSDPGYIRLQRVIQVTLNPVQYNPVRHEARISSRMVVHVAFNSTPVTQGAASAVRPGVSTGVIDSEFDPYYENIIVNYESGKKWRKSAKPVLSKKSSPFLSGLWFTIPVSEEGIYRITYEDLVANGIIPENLDPRTIRIYNNGGRELPENIIAPRPDGLLENAIRVVGEQDGAFDVEDYILFYGRDTKGWEWDAGKDDWRHFQSVYSRENIYWFTFGGDQGRRMQVKPFPGSTQIPVDSAGAIVFLEIERHKMHGSGNNWYMDLLNAGNSIDYSTQLPGYKPGSIVDLSVLAQSVTRATQFFSLEINNGPPRISTLSGFNEGVIIHSDTTEVNGDVAFRITNTTQSSNRLTYIDWYKFDYVRNLAPVDGFIKFFAPDTVGIFSFELQNIPDDSLDIYNITDIENVHMLDFTYNPADSTALFSDDLSEGKQQFYVVRRNHYKSVTAILPKPVKNLIVTDLAIDMVIISPEEFVSAAGNLKNFRQTHDNLATEVVTVQDIYDNFSAGLQDPVAIRDFVKFAFENWRDNQNNPLQYLLLFGDGHYDYLGVKPTSAPMWVPSFQINNVNPLATRVKDDFFGIVSGNDNFLDIAIGRLPVQSLEMAQGVVDKIIQYESEPFFGPWRNRIGFTADDEITPNSSFERLHTDQTEFIARASYIPPFLDQRKIYLMEFPPVRDVTSSSTRKPEAEDAMVDLINDGVYILNYVGHGNERVLAHEWLLNREIDMPRIDNGRMQFFFYLSSCTFGRWDFPNEDSMGELLVTRENRGAIALVSAARDVFAGPNHALMNAFYGNFFSNVLDTRRTQPLGIAMMQAKLTINIVNSEKYHLLGDPSMSLKLPDEIISISSIQPDSIKALATVRVSGTIDSQNPFEGSLALSVFDTEKDGEHIMLNGNIVNYKLPGSPIFKGSVELDAGSENQYDMGFVVPKDITYGGENGRISLYVWNDEGDGSISVDGLPVGGTRTGVFDDEGPEIEVLFDGRRFVSGDIVSTDPELELRLSDPHGINITGEIGHKIELVTDDNPNVVDLSGLFEYDNGSFSTGKANFRIAGLSAGQHTITVRAWDNFNNSSTFRGILSVVADDELIVRDVFNYPNPFTDNTQFTCQINAAAEIEIKIYTVRGRLIKSLNYFHSGGSTFFTSPEWDGTDEDGDKLANGTYMYKLIARSDAGGELRQVEKLSKLVVIR